MLATREPASEAVCIVGFGALTPVGGNALASMAAVRAKISRLQHHPFMIDSAGDPYKVALLPLDPALPLVERFGVIARETLGQVTSLLMEKVTDQAPAVDLLLGLPNPRPGLPEDIGYTLAEALREEIRGCALNTYTAATGHVSGAQGIRSSLRRLRQTETLFCLVCGIDSYMDAQTLTWLDASRQLHTQENPWGLIPGEGGGACLLCTRTTARRYGLPVYAEVIAASATAEGGEEGSPAVGRALTNAVSDLLAKLPDEQSVQTLLADANGQIARTDDLGFMLARLGNRIENIGQMITPADCWGDMGAATVPLLAALASYEVNKNPRRGPNCLVVASSGYVPPGVKQEDARGAVLIDTRGSFADKDDSVWP